jgi:hypothetical protein
MCDLDKAMQCPQRFNKYIELISCILEIYKAPLKTIIIKVLDEMEIDLFGKELEVQLIKQLVIFQIPHCTRL